MLYKKKGHTKKRRTSSSLGRTALILASAPSYSAGAALPPKLRRVVIRLRLATLINILEEDNIFFLFIYFTQSLSSLGYHKHTHSLFKKKSQKTKSLVMRMKSTNDFENPILSKFCWMFALLSFKNRWWLEKNRYLREWVRERERERLVVLRNVNTRCLSCWQSGLSYHLLWHWW